MNGVVKKSKVYVTKVSVLLHFQMYGAKSFMGYMRCESVLVNTALQFNLQFENSCACKTSFDLATPFSFGRSTDSGRLSVVPWRLRS
jgi:hypothetical protein